MLESEWGSVRLRRQRMLLQHVRLIRPYSGRVAIVGKKYAKWQQLTAEQQYYVLWHTDTYHMPWGEFAGEWRQYIETIQEYLPLVWEVLNEGIELKAKETNQWLQLLLDAFIPIWEEKGLDCSDQPTSLVWATYKKMALPLVMRQLLFNGWLARYGIISQRNNRYLKVTDAGKHVIQAERTANLACGLDLLD